MKKRLIATLMFVCTVTGACSLITALRPGPGGYTAAQVQTFLTDAKWGLDEGCSQQWVPADACTFGDDALNTAIAIVQKDVPNIEAAVKKSLQDSEVKLAVDSRLRPYLDWVIAILHG